MTNGISHPFAPRDVAIIGIAIRFPGADTVEEFWQNLRNGVESITTFTDDELRKAGVSEAMLADPAFVKAQPTIRNTEYFDAAFFGYKPREAEGMDPQLRVFLECSWEALESAGYDPERVPGPVAVYAGNNLSNYLIFNILPVIEQVTAGSAIGIVSYNDKDALATVVSHKLNLRGPSISVQTFCSTSLVAVHLACQSLMTGEAEMALAGGVSLSGSEVAGYYFEEGGIKSPDGHNRSFDARGKGTVFGNGAGVVVLKPLARALADRNHIHAVIRGSAVNNDGSQKAGYTAPSVDGQAEAIRRALSVSGVDPRSIGYVETHGTATAIGDPIEVQAMTRAFRAWTERRGFCAIGSVKSNVGHLDRAAGVAGLVKAALVLEHGQIPPSLHFESPNPKIDFDGSPFFVNTRLRDFPGNGAPRRAAVSSLGIGGTNAHVVLEEAPARPAPAPSRASQLLVVSARTETALDQATARMAKFLRQHPDASLPDVSFTLQVGRRAFAHRRSIVGRDIDALLRALDSRDPDRTCRGSARSSAQEVAFLFPGQGAQYAQMARGLYDSEPLFREEVDGACTWLREESGMDLLAALYPSPGEEDAASEALRQTRMTQPGLFVIEHALARLWMSWGIKPAAMIGHSVGEYVAACLSGVMTRDQALGLLAARGALMQALPVGAMLAVPCPEHALGEYLGAGVSLAAVNAAQSCVLAGPPEAIASIERALDAAGMEGRRLHTSHAFHSAMMDPLLGTFTAIVSDVPLKPPSIPYVSNVTGDWITAAEATDPAYWGRHLRHTVRFADGVATLFARGAMIPLEVGPGRSLGQLLRQHPAARSVPAPVATLRAATDMRSDVDAMLAALGCLWTQGASVDWDGFWASESRSRVVLPTYPFERQRYWIEAAAQERSPRPRRRADLGDWFYVPTWKRGPVLPPFRPGGVAATWLVLSDARVLANALVARLHEAGQQVVSATSGEGFREPEADHFVLDPANRADWAALLDAVGRRERMPLRIVSFWSLSAGAGEEALDRYGAAQDRGFFALLSLAQALGDRRLDARVEIGVVTDTLHSVAGEPGIEAERATLLGPCRVMSQEYAEISCRNIDVPPIDGATVDDIVAFTLAEMSSRSSEPVVAFRGGYRWTVSYERTRLDAGPVSALRDRGVYLVTGGLGGLGLTMAEHLAASCHARLGLVQRTVLPDEADWPAWLRSHDEADRTSRRIRAVGQVRASGGEVMILAADASRLDEMERAVDRLEHRFGPVNGVLHAAGVAGDGIMQLKTRDVAAAVIDPKVKGALVLERVLRNRPLDFFLLFSSTAAVLGSFGQVDYTGANSFLDVFASAPRSGGGPLVSINWDAWSEVGMAVETRPRRPAVVPRGGPAFEPIEHPYFQRRRVHGLTTTFAGAFTAERFWFLNEHRLYGHPTLPATAYLEIARSVAPPIGERMLEIRDVVLLTPCAVPQDQSREVECSLADNAGEWEFVLRSRGSDSQWVEHCRGHLVAVETIHRRAANLVDLAASCGDRRIDSPELAWDQMAGRIEQVGAHLALGPRWMNLRQMLCGRDRELLLQALPAAVASDVDVAPLHPALLDFTGLMPLETEGVYIPFSFDCVRLFAPLPAAITTLIVNRDDLKSGKETVAFDATVMDREGRTLVELEGMTLRRIDRFTSLADGVRLPSASAAAAAVLDGPDEAVAVLGGPDENVRLMMESAGAFSALELRPAPRQVPEQGQVEIEVSAAGLNFKDVLRALGMIPGMPGGDVSAGFGSECAGRVARVGAGVTTVKPGDEVMAIAPGAFGRFAITLADLVLPIPAGLGFEQAATIPLVFLTAHHALVNQARLARRDRVLIHAAAGGVGLAAVQIARHIGAEIYATAGSQAKREYLNSLGVEHVSTSRSLAFADDIRAWTGGEGVDVVLNSLAGEFIPASLALLRPYGRFLEIGARDIYQNAPLGLRPFGNNLTFSAVDMGPMFFERPETVRSMFVAILDHFERREYRPLPVQSVSIHQAEQAFELMAAARQIGKIALEVQPMARSAMAVGRGPAGSTGPATRAADGLATGMPPDLGDRIAPAEGVEAFRRVLAARHPQVIVSPRDLAGVMEWQRQAISSLQDAPQATAPVQTRVQLPRPELSMPFVAPRTEAESQIAEIWRDLLGVNPVGIHDRFFELGGDSLIGVQVLSRIRKALNVQLPSSVLYEGPTVESLATLVSGGRAEGDAFAAQRGRAERRRERQQQRERR